MLAPALLFTALLLAWWRPTPEQWDPVVTWRRMALNLERRVNHVERPVSQKRLAGVLALLTLSVPILLLVLLLRPLLVYPQVLDLPLLYICCQIRPVLEADHVSELWQRLIIQLLTPLLCYWLGGAVAVLAYAMLRETVTCWPVIQSRMVEFGHWPNELFEKLNWPAQQLLSISLRAIGCAPEQPMQLIAAQQVIRIVLALWFAIYVLLITLQSLAL